MDIEYKWLPHLDGAIPSAGQGKRISTYTVALEGWRRGLKLKFYSVFEDGNKLKVRYSLSNEGRTHHFQLSMGDKVSDEAFKICDDKDLTKQFLKKENVPVPQGQMFGIDKPKGELIKYGLALGFPLVVKPTDGNAGKGVFANITTEEELSEVVDYIREELEFEDVIVEKYVEGEEFRIYVLEDRVLGAMNRVPANIVGDGIHTIRELIHQKNAQRKLNPHLTSRLIKIDREIEAILEEKEYELNSIPKKDEVIYLREKSNLSTGGEAIDVTEELTPELEKIAIDAGKAIPGLSHYGVDMIVSDDRKKGVILEVNSRPGLGGHMFPGQGKPRDFAKEIIDYYFPETKGGYRSNLYFDFDSILEAVMSRSVEDINVIPPPLEPLYGEKYVIQVDKEFTYEFRRRIRRQAIKREMHGYLEQIEGDIVTVVLLTTELSDLDKIKQIIKEKMKLNILEELEWNKPLLMGFKTTSDTDLSKSEIRDLLVEKQQLERDYERIEKRYAQIQKSRFWRITSPLRYVIHNIKLLIRTIISKD